MMRIAFVSVSDQLGGSEAMLLQTAAELRRFRPDWDLHVVVPGGGPLGTRAAALGMQVSTLPMPGSLARMGESGLSRGRAGAGGIMLARAALSLPAYERQLRDLLSAISPDIVHTNGFKAHVLSSRARTPARAIVWHMHEYISRRPLTRRLIKHYASRCSLMVANSESVAADVRSVTGAGAEVRVIYNAVDLARFSPSGPVADLDALAGLTPAPEGTVRVGLVATFSRWKGHDTFLRAVAALPPSLMVRPYIVGGALYDTDRSQYSADELRAVAASYGLAGRVGFTGFIESADQAMRALDVVVHASTSPEPFGLVIAEAMACGRALVTSATGGAAELVRSGEDAVTHRPGDAADLAAAIAMLASDPGARLRLGAEARAAAARRFDARRLAGDFALAYEAAARLAVSHA
jgi:glycosyltransferase involved in cell wall biosynthesis